MKVTWLGQAGLLLDNGKHEIMIDPYLSDAVAKKDPEKYRRTPVNADVFAIQPDVLIFTHDHLDHYDPETAEVFLGKDRKPLTVLCPFSVWQKVRAFGGAHNYVLFDRHTQWSEFGFRFQAVKASHSDSYAIGVVIDDLETHKAYYVTGDTLYNSEIFADLPENINAVFLPINGVGNNMNAEDALRFFNRCGARTVVAYHVGMFDNIPQTVLNAPNQIVLEAYQVRELGV